MYKVVSVFILSIISIFGLQAQNVEQQNDSIIDNLRKEFLSTSNQNGSALQQATMSNSANSDLPEVDYVGIETAPIDLHLNIHEKGSTLPSWGSGFITGYHGGYQDYRIGGVSYAGASLYQSFNRYWSASVGANLSKFGVYYNQASFNGSVHYQPNKYIGITAFGSYSPGSFMSSMPIGQSFYYGGYITLESDSHWGIDLGAVQSYDGMMGTHSTTPIVRPYYNLNGAKLGIDFGPMLQQMMRKNNSLDFSPTGPRPIKALPPVAPRR